MTDLPRSPADDRLDHLVRQPCATLATIMRAQFADSPDRAAGLAKLAEAQECFERAAAAPEPAAGLDRVRAAIRRARGGEPHPQPRGFA